MSLPVKELVFTCYQPEYGLETVKMWRRSFQQALGIEQHNRLEELADHLEHFKTFDPKSIQIALNTQTSEVIGFKTQEGEELHHLFIHADYQGQGIGSRFITEAKKQSPSGIYLYTFVLNLGAQRFYQHHGFHEVERGFADLAGNPWASTKQQLADIRYHWSPSQE